MFERGQTNFVPSWFIVFNRFPHSIWWKLLIILLYGIKSKEGSYYSVIWFSLWIAALFLILYRSIIWGHCHFRQYGIKNKAAISLTNVVKAIAALFFVPYIVVVFEGIAESSLSCWAKDANSWQRSYNLLVVISSCLDLCIFCTYNTNYCHMHANYCFALKHIYSVSCQEGYRRVVNIHVQGCIIRQAFLPKIYTSSKNNLDMWVWIFTMWFHGRHFVRFLTIQPLKNM